jgi:hypothetical protein
MERIALKTLMTHKLTVSMSLLEQTADPVPCQAFTRTPPAEATLNCIYGVTAATIPSSIW